MNTPIVAKELGEQLAALGWVTDLLVGGSVATGDYIPYISDLDLVAVVASPVDRQRQEQLCEIHRMLDAGTGAGLKLGCVYVESHQLDDPSVLHPTWTHGSFVRRILSGVSRAELVRQGYAIFGRNPIDLLPAMTDDEIRRAARDELTGYWTWAARRPWLWLDPVLADLGLTSMARGRHTMATGELLTKSRAADQANAPVWLVRQLKARRQGEPVNSPRFRTAMIAWRDARRTVATARRTR